MIGKSCLYIIACVDNKIKYFSHVKTGSIEVDKSTEFGDDRNHASKENVTDNERNRRNQDDSSSNPHSRSSEHNKNSNRGSIKRDWSDASQNVDDRYV